MKSLETINSLHNLNLGVSPNECDIAIVSIDYAGTPGMLNSLVLKEYGYSIDDIPTQSQLKYGFGTITDKTRKSIIFVVIFKGENTIENLKNNLYKALVEFKDWIRDKKIWLPLMGTGAGGLSLDESYAITARTINRFQEEYPTDTTFLISIPNTPEGKKLFNKFNVTQSNESLDAEFFVKAFKGKFYLVGSIWNKEYQLPRFFQEGIWEKGHEDESYSRLISQVKKNDILIVKST